MPIEAAFEAFNAYLQPHLTSNGWKRPTAFDSQRTKIPQTLSFYTAKNVGYQSHHPSLHPGPPTPGPPTFQPRVPAAPPSNNSGYEPPGQYFDGHMPRADGWSYLSPGRHTTIRFVGPATPRMAIFRMSCTTQRHTCYMYLI